MLLFADVYTWGPLSTTTIFYSWPLNHCTKNVWCLSFGTSVEKLLKAVDRIPLPAQLGVIWTIYRPKTGDIIQTLSTHHSQVRNTVAKHSRQAFSSDMSVPVQTLPKA